MHFKKLMILGFMVSQLAACAHHAAPVEEGCEHCEEKHSLHESKQPSTANKIIKKAAIGTTMVTGTAIKAVGSVLNYCGRVVSDGAKAQSGSKK